MDWRRSWILTFYGIFMRDPNSKWTDTKIFQTNFNKTDLFNTWIQFGRPWSLLTSLIPTFINFVLIYLLNMLELFLWKTKRITVSNAFQKILNESACKPNKIWVSTCSDLYNRPDFYNKLWLKDNDIKWRKIRCGWRIY